MEAQQQKYVFWAIVACVVAFGLYQVRLAAEAFAGRSPVPGVVAAADIGDLVVDAKSRQQLAAYTDSWAMAVPHLRDLGHYYDAQKVADEALQKTGKLPAGLAAFDQARAERLERALGLDPSRTDLKPLSLELIKISSELRD
jgi:hypothetical protein